MFFRVTPILRNCLFALCGGMLAIPSSALAAVRFTRQEQLKEMSLQQLGNVEVTSVSKVPEQVWQTPAAISVITQDDIEHSGATTIPELLRMVPGVEVAREQSDQWAVSIRGFLSQFSKGLLVLIDGRSVYTPLFEGVYWDVQDLPLADIDRIEVIRGPGGTIWGPNAVNGVINIITKNAAETQGTMVHLIAGGPVDRFIGVVQLGMTPLPDLRFRLFAKGFNRGPEMNPGGDPYDHWHQERGGFRLDWQPDNRDHLTASSMVYAGRSGDQNAIGEFFPPSQKIVDSDQIVSGGNLILRWDRQQQAGSSFYVQGYFDRTNRHTSQFTETRNTFDLDVIESLANLPRQNVVLGAGLRESPSNIVQTQATVNFLPHAINNYVYSLFGQDSFSLIPDRVTMTLGSKVENNNYSGWGVEPSAQLLWRPRGDMTFWGSVSRALRIPGRVDRDLTLIGNAVPSPPIFVSITGNPHFQPEVLIGWNAGYRQLLRRRLFVDVAAFHNQYDDLESYGGPVPLFTFPTTPYSYTQINVQYANGLRGVTDGVEIAPDWKPTDWLELRGNFSHVHMNLHSKPGYSQASYAATYTGSSPHRQVFLQSTFTLPHKITVSPDYRFVSRLPAQSVPSYQTADARIAFHFKDRVELSANGHNLLQPYHREFSGDSSNPVGIHRDYYGELRWSW